MLLIHAFSFRFTLCLPMRATYHLQAGTGDRAYAAHGQVLRFYIHSCCVDHILTVPIERVVGRSFRQRLVNVKFVSFCEMEADSGKNVVPLGGEYPGGYTTVP